MRRIILLGAVSCVSLSAGIIQMFPWCLSGPAIVPCVASSNVLIGNGNTFAAYPNALSTPAIPVITNGGAAGSTTYGYMIVWLSQVGLSAASPEGTTATGNASLSGSDFNIITPTACPAGAIGYRVFRTTGGDSGWIGDGTCGVAFHDTGIPTYPGGIFWPSTESAFNTSNGAYFGQTIRGGDLGDVPQAGLWGSDLTLFDQDMLSWGAFYGSYAFAHFGTVNNAPAPLVSVLETTDTGAYGMQSFSFTKATGTTVGVSSWAGNTGALTNSRAAAYWANILITQSGDITEATGFQAERFQLDGSGTIGTVRGFWARDRIAVGGTANYMFYTDANSGSNTWAFYGAGTAPAHFGGNIESSSYSTSDNCSSSASPAVCGSAAAGSVAIPTGVSSVALTVNTTRVTANSQILLTSDDTLGTKLGVTCNSTLATLVGGLAITARTAGTSFEISYNGTIATNPLCVSYAILN